MKAVQTFWSGRKDPLINSFGWMHPQYHLMSWALSCLTLKKNFEEVVMYTDSVGYTLFKDKLQLPYTKIIKQYDNLECHEYHWAYAKLLTYYFQEEPFIHVDGDVYLPNGLNKNLQYTELIAQNKESGTSYYRTFMDRILQRGINIKPYLRSCLERESIPSYNAGVFGGNDIEFIKKYCQEAFDFIEGNNIDKAYCQNIDGNHNILFEQILFACLAEKEGERVDTIIDRNIHDNGYTYNDFCDFYSFENSQIMHIIGGHKRNDRICELLSRTLLNKYPEYYNRIVALFPQDHIRINNSSQNVFFYGNNLLLRSMKKYNLFLRDLSIEWKGLENKELLNMDQKLCHYLSFMNKDRNEKLSTRIKRNPHLSIYEDTKEWPQELKEFTKNRLKQNQFSNHFNIVCIPVLLNEGYKEVLIDDLSYNLLILLDKEKTLESLLEQIRVSIPPKITNESKIVYNMLLNALEYLFYNKLIYTD
ncbi:DUF6734 family protein [Dysgonomonas sp. Marseille-P4361]|uniref:DUF6734 family protein n=1 Tax=Dysgonomonas sp. Marseille-P4361 TaxID=2161820 RepID=UPI000D558D90|nr:DUF6734 family protein [Dysgonomonas sp. Marseille-P4361]